MGRYVGTGKNRRYQVKKGKRWVFAKKPRRSATPRKAARRSTRKVVSMPRRRGRSRSSRKRSGGRRGGKLISLSAVALGVGGAAAVSGTVQTYVASAHQQAAPLLALVGITSGTGFIGAVLAMKALCHLMPRNRIAIAYRAMLAGWGFKP